MINFKIVRKTLIIEIFQKCVLPVRLQNLISLGKCIIIIDIIVVIIIYSYKTSNISSKF